MAVKTYNLNILAEIINMPNGIEEYLDRRIPESILI